MGRAHVPGGSAPRLESIQPTGYSASGMPMAVAAPVLLGVSAEVVTFLDKQTVRGSGLLLAIADVRAAG